MTKKEFRELVYLQEANRRFFHPLGLALALTFEPDGSDADAPVDDEVAVKREMGETLQRLGDVAASHDATYALYSAAKDAFADLTRALEGK